MSFPRYDDYKHSGLDWLGILPSHWQALPNKAVFRLVKTEIGEEWSETQLLSLTLRGVVNRDIDSGDGKYPADFGNYQIVEPDDLVMCLFDMDETPRTVGLSSNRGMITSAYDVFRCNPKTDAAFVYYFYRHVDSHKGLRPFYTGLRKTVRTPTFLSIKMPVPPLDEQKAISSFLDVETQKIDALVSEQQRLIELLQEKRQAVISHAVTKGLNPDVPMKASGVEWLGDVPEHWEVQRVKHAISSIEQGWSPQCENDPVQSADQWGVLKVGCVNYGRFNAEENKALPSTLEPQPELGIREGDLLISRANTVELVGSAAVAESDHENLMLCDKLYRLRMDRSTLLPQFLCYFLACEAAREPIELGASGASSSMKNIAQSVILELWFAAPDVDEQQEIVNAIRKRWNAITRLIAEAERAIQLLQERRTALISAAVTGKIDVRSLARKASA
ncbi:restriction endonuclease subunit S [Planctellipticum variicoloris]|uniref:restriction endonuclease subunit S n=1 Tax=Planctellipticum variicoloris TaxID=3064265 RepID=UPI0030140348|nr:restriction endonuclease subunit S [Planctomycetaceae bacterium SH412]